MQLALGTGAYNSEREYRDVVHETLDVPIPVTYDANYTKVPVQMQNKLGICTAEAVCSLIERYRNDGVVLSRRFTYMVGKKLVDGNLDEGSAIKSMLQGAYKYGTQPESMVPTDTTLSYADFVNFDPSPYIVTATKIPGYVNVPVETIREGIYKYQGVAVRFDCGDSWYTAQDGRISWQPGDILPIRYPTSIVSGHAVVFTSYDQYILWLRNSWSTQWASNGNGYCSYSPTEAWAISDTPIAPPTLPSPQSWKHYFSTDLNYGMKDNDEVKNLQVALSILGYLDKKYITGNYLDFTAAAVLRFQYAHVVDSFATRMIVFANVGKHCSSLTRAALNKIFG